MIFASVHPVYLQTNIQGRVGMENFLVNLIVLGDRSAFILVVPVLSLLWLLVEVTLMSFSPRQAAAVGKQETAKQSDSSAGQN